jgi:hypothetical protein
MGTKMSVLPTMTCAGTMPEMKDTTWSRARREGAFVLAVAAALAMAACGDITIGPVDHSCPVENACQHAGGR